MEELQKVDLASMDITENLKDKLKQIIPSAFKEGKICFDSLKTALGDIVEPNREFYNFTWAGKSEAFRTLQKTTHSTLRPCIEESVNYDNTDNIFIEGDNLEVLKLLQKTYHEKIKMIYIDPPYNKDKDFLYPDRWSEGIKSYKEYCKFVDEGGKLTSSEDEATSTQGRKHSKWLTMMYPRLFLARNLLKEDGVIFISIDDDEVKNLKMICDEIFGEENFIDIFNWTKTETPANLSKKSKKVIEYILCYQKVKNDSKFKGIVKESLSSNGLLNQTNRVAKLIFPKNKILTSMEDGIIKKGEYGTDSYIINLTEDTEVKNGIFIKDVILESKFKWTQDKLNEELNKGTIIKIPTARLSPSYDKKEYEPEVPPNLINSKVFVETNENAGVALTKIFEKKIFDFPKPISLIKYLMNFDSDENEIILDFFAGSGTTAHAVMDLNKEDNGNRKFIMVQIPEYVDKDSEAYKAGYKTIAEISKERIRRAGNEIKKSNPETKIDLGFKVFKLDESNFKQWDSDIKEEIQLKQKILNFENNVIEGSDKLDMVYELLIKKGYDLNANIEKISINRYYVALAQK